MKLLDEVRLYEIRPLFFHQLFFVLEMSSALLPAAYVQVHFRLSFVLEANTMSHDRTGYNYLQYRLPKLSESLLYLLRAWAVHIITLVNVYVDLVVFTRIAGTS